nr:ABC transporter ATP-binding protein [Herpetosiphonaceae bacterium]
MKVHVNDISWGTATQRIINAISLDVTPGTLVGILGPNGSG